VSDLPHLIRLLDDETDVVRRAVRQRLEGMRKELPARLAELDLHLTSDEERLIGELLAPSTREELEDRWLEWRDLPNDCQRIESALSQISAFLSGWKNTPKDVSRALDALARKVEAGAGEQSICPRFLAEQLFGNRGTFTVFKGNSRDYYAPENSNLLWVIRRGVGNPLSLCVIYRLIGWRLGLDIGGCNFPGHFLARVIMDNQLWLVDCFNRGRFMLASDVAKHHPAANPGMEELVHAEATAESVIMRVLRNLDDSFDKRGLGPERQLMRKLAVRMMDQ
jgi:regulator of sirC expression with transglutaminase-like and TPR domain